MLCRSQEQGLGQTSGADKRTTARFLAYGVNGLSVSLMWLRRRRAHRRTGAEFGTAGGGAVLGQKLLEAGLVTRPSNTRN